MGRQTLVAMTDRDEETFLTFLRSTADFQLLESKAPTKEAIWVDRFAPREQGHWQYYIWNKAFSWTIEYGQVNLDAPVVERRGWYYIRNASIAPVIEYDRHNFSQGLQNGRVYWAKSWADGPPSEHYDVEAFTRWYDKVVRWIRKQGKQRKIMAYNPYYLPDALLRAPKS